jgi:hypothetical protein
MNGLLPDSYGAQLFPVARAGYGLAVFSSNSYPRHFTKTSHRRPSKLSLQLDVCLEEFVYVLADLV